MQKLLGSVSDAVVGQQGAQESLSDTCFSEKGEYSVDLTRFKRLNLFRRPTPLEELARLQQAIGCKPRIFLKRDDLTDSGLGGNKNRKLDFIMAMRWPRVQT